MREQMSLEKLRFQLPGWTWRAERNGFGWGYVGQLGDRSVRVYATAVLCGPSDDNSVTVWRVEEGANSDTFFVWAMRETYAEREEGKS